MKNLRGKFGHKIAGQPLALDYYAIVAAIFNEDSYPSVPPTRYTPRRTFLFSAGQTQRSLKEAFDILAEKGLTALQAEKIRECLRSAIHAHEAKFFPDGIKRTDYSDKFFLGVRINGQQISDAFAKQIKNSFVSNLSDIMGWKLKTVDSSTPYGIDRQWPPIDELDNKPH